MPVDKETVDILAETAILAGIFGLAREGAALSAALSAAAPGDANVAMVQATALISGRRYDEAGALLRDVVLAEDPDNSIAKAFLGFALKLSGKVTEAEQTCQEVLDADDDADAVTVAKALLAR